MSKIAHLWAVGYDDLSSAKKAREAVTQLTGPGQYLLLFDAAILLRHADGSFSLDHKPFPVTSNILGCGTIGLLAGLALAAPMTGAAIGALVGCAASTVATTLKIEPEFIRDVQSIMRPGKSALLILDEEGDMAVILHAIRGLGGTVLKTNVDLDRARLIQSTLSSARLTPAVPT